MNSNIEQDFIPVESCNHPDIELEFIDNQEDARGGSFPLYNCKLCGSTISREKSK